MSNLSKRGLSTDSAEREIHCNESVMLLKKVGDLDESDFRDELQKLQPPAIKDGREWSGYYYMHMWGINRKKWREICNEKITECQEKGELESEASYQECLDHLNGSIANLDIAHCSKLGIGKTESSSVNDSMKIGHSSLKRLVVAAIKKIHRRNKNGTHLADPEITAHVDNWDIYAGVVGVRGGNVTQDLHMDIDLPAEYT